MGDQVTTPGRRHVADGWSIVGSQRWLIGYPSHHPKDYVVPTLGQRYQPNGWVAHVGPALGERWHANHDVRPTMPTMYQRRINVLLLTGMVVYCLVSSFTKTVNQKVTDTFNTTIRFLLKMPWTPNFCIAFQKQTQS